MKRLNFLISSIAFLFVLSLKAQSIPSCSGDRYQEFIFSEVDSTIGIQYGRNTTASGTTTDLFLDIYVPKNDTASKRPLVIFIFGGSFLGGQRSDMATYCTFFARKGYVTATIDYRLYDQPLFPFPTQEEMLDVIAGGISDTKGAIRFLVNGALEGNPYGIDTDNIFLGGISSGAICAIHTAYLDESDLLSPTVETAILNNGGFRGNSNSFIEDFSVKGVLNYSGAILDSQYMNAQEPPIISFHDDADAVVPFHTGSTTFLGIPLIEMSGSQSIAHQATSVDIPNQLVIIPESNEHVSYFSSSAPTWRDSVLAASSQFMFELTCPLRTSIETDRRMSSFSLFPNPSSGHLNIQSNEEFSTIRIYDPIGKVVFQKPIPSKSFSIDTELIRGTYYVELIGQSKSELLRLAII